MRHDIKRLMGFQNGNKFRSETHRCKSQHARMNAQDLHMVYCFQLLKQSLQTLIRQDQAVAARNDDFLYFLVAPDIIKRLSEMIMVRRWPLTYPAFARAKPTIGG